MRDIFNERLLNNADYKDIRKLKALINSWRTLEELSYKGDTVATSILMDLKKALGLYGNKTPLSRREVRAIKENLIYGYSQAGIAKNYGVSQKTVSTWIYNGLKKISKLLEED